MTHIDEDAQTVHLTDNFFSERTDTTPCVLTLRGRVTDIIVTIMAEGHIDNATISKMLQILQFPVKGDAILNAKHDALAASPFVIP